ncbi:MAG: hypothetical protein LW832_04490 [Parachlamydia sp.]|jgi:hypothetical protein|nr:hypothetical protein [Parachlamydia sp.]
MNSLLIEYCVRDQTFYLNPDHLSNQHLHFFYPFEPCVELVLSTALECVTLRHANVMKIKKIQCSDIELFWVSFPKEYIKVCFRIAKMFDFKLFNKSVEYLQVTKECGSYSATSLIIPSNKKIICIVSQIFYSERQIFNACENLTWFGRSLDITGVD